MKTSVIPSGDPDTPWVQISKLLRLWFFAYLALWIVWLIVMANFQHSNDAVAAATLATVVVYIGVIIASYKLQKHLNSIGLYKHRAWQIIAGALLLNPFLLGFLIPLSTILADRKCSAK